MGQYYLMVNLDKKQYMRPHAFDSGAKLMELSSGTEGPMRSAGAMLRVGKPWFGDRLVLAGDYADEGRFLPADKSTRNLYSVASEEYQGLSPQETKVLAEDGLPETTTGFAMERLGKTFSWSNLPRKGKFEFAYDPKAWASLILEDFDEFLDMIECPVSSNVAQLSDTFGSALRWSVLFGHNKTKYRFAKFLYPNVVKEDEESEKSTVAMRMEESDRSGVLSVKEVTLVFPCTFQVIMDAFEPTEFLMEALQPAEPKEIQAEELPPTPRLEG